MTYKSVGNAAEYALVHIYITCIARLMGRQELAELVLRISSGCGGNTGLKLLIFVNL